MTPKLAGNLLRSIGWGFIVFGVVFVTIAFVEYDGFAQTLTNVFDWTGGPHTEDLTRDARWFAAIMSGLSAGFGALYVFLVAPLLSLPNSTARRLAKRGGLIAVVLWFVIDNIGSLAAGVPSNVAMNTLFLIAIAGPLIMVKFPDELNVSRTT